MSKTTYPDEKLEPGYVDGLDPEASNSIDTLTALIAEGEKSINPYAKS
jgi:hypothetical protein